MSKLTQLSVLALLMGSTAALDAVLDDQELLRAGVPQKKLSIQLQCMAIEEQNPKGTEASAALTYKTSLDEALKRKEDEEKELNKIIAQLEDHRKEEEEEELLKAMAEFEKLIDEKMAKTKSLLDEKMTEAEKLINEKKALTDRKGQKAAKDQKEKKANITSIPTSQPQANPAVVQPKPAAAVVKTTVQAPKLKPTPAPSKPKPQIVIPIGSDVTKLVSRVEKNVPNELQKGAAKIEKGLNRMKKKFNL